MPSDLEQFDDTIGIVTNEFTHGILTVAFTNGIRRIDRLIALEITRHLARVTMFFPRIKTFGADAFAVPVASLVLAVEIVDQNLAITAHKTVVLVRPLLRLAGTVGFEKYCKRDGGGGLVKGNKYKE